MAGSLVLGLGPGYDGPRRRRIPLAIVMPGLEPGIHGYVDRYARIPAKASTRAKRIQIQMPSQNLAGLLARS
jgi:hypothetical protein